MSEWEREFDEWEREFDELLRKAVKAWEGRIDHGAAIADYMWDELNKGQLILVYHTSDYAGEDANEED